MLRRRPNWKTEWKEKNPYKKMTVKVCCFIYDNILKMCQTLHSRNLLQRLTGCVNQRRCWMFVLFLHVRSKHPLYRLSDVKRLISIPFSVHSSTKKGPIPWPGCGRGLSPPCISSSDRTVTYGLFPFHPPQFLFPHNPFFYTFFIKGHA